MASEWDAVLFEDAPLQIIDGDRGKNYPKRSEFTQSGYCIFLNTGNVTKEGFNLSSLAFISQERDELLRKGKLQREDVVLTTRGTVGNVAYFNGNIPYEHIRINSGMVILRPDPSLLHPIYLYSFVGSLLFKSQVKSLSTGSAQPQLPIRDIKRININLPPLPEQKAIAHVLGTLDDRIELNRRMNETLEGMAQALFKSWFVDFDPVIDNAIASKNVIPDEFFEKGKVKRVNGEIQRVKSKVKMVNNKKDTSPFNPYTSHFPSEFTYSDEMGWIPMGWKEKQIGDLLELAYGKSLAAKKREPGPFPVYGSGGIAGFHKVAIVVGPGIIVGRKGTIGSVYWEPTDFYPIDTVFFVKPKTDMPLFWFYQNLKNMDIASLGADSAVPVVNRNAVYFKKWIVPGNPILKEYWTLLRGSVEKQQFIKKQNDTLSTLRDTLLPKLLSGELRIPDAEKMVEEAV